MRWIRCAAVATLALTITACTTSPTGRQQFTLMSDAQLNQMGREAYDQYQQDLPAAGQAQQRYAQCVASAIITALPEQERNQDWQIRVFESEQANAFALPGGYMGVNTGLFDVAVNQDQLAAVIGHEVGHVLARHANERVSTQTSTQLALSVLSSAAGMQGPGGEQLMGALGLGAQYGILLPFSRRHESEADVIGLRLMADAGFDPRASLELWDNMSAQGGARPPAWMSTHPSHGQRMQGLQAEMDNAVARYEQARQAGRQPNCPRP
ncbi:MAG: M48 family metallopeptidase [Halomonas sp.]|jgi:predicted Zn-dependent protease|uniref:M48 family peptidase n=1 Tax=Billgrantia tianxiuensis TaxID=2497861 RepID=A0A6I6SQ67_9GAMM|nr:MULTISPECIES: M48 family metallopeptidase [Halomonas]MCE8033847.1 M48 family metallopeptidase [Halomonas sp. MCCC 1A11057]MDX5434052.1 M48 family metallopeptidase [Halomonas sp.]QHC51401.1 M48 family peptidase [Halomonas tianxiuensis]